jgi:hypothetical protein
MRDMCLSASAQNAPDGVPPSAVGRRKVGASYEGPLDTSGALSRATKRSWVTRFG